MKRTAKYILRMFALLMVIASILSVYVAALDSVIDEDNNIFTACFTYHIRASASSSATSLQTVSVTKNRIAANDSSYGTSGTYSYSTTGWMGIMPKNSNTKGYARRDLVCPSDRCYKVTSTSGLNVRTGVGTDKPILCSIEYGDYVELRSDQSNGNWYYVRVRTGVHEGEKGYVSFAYLGQVNSHTSPD